MLGIVLPVGMVATMIAVCVFGKNPPDCCPSCLHDDEADQQGYCKNADAVAGWGSDDCLCTNPYHRSRRRALHHQAE